MNTLQIYNELQQKCKDEELVKESDIVAAIGQENFIALVRSFMIVRHHKDADGTVWYEL